MRLNKLWRRLLPLYLSSFFEGLIFWYAIEKVFMTSIGFTPTSIAIVVIVMAVTGLVLEIPSGILADRWSRKGVLMTAYMALGLSSLLLGLSDTILEYTLASALFAAYFSLHTGTQDAIIYDALIEENDSRAGFEKYLGLATVFASVGLVIGSLLGGLIGDKIGLTSPYFLSVPPAILSVVILAWFREPKLHKQHTPTHLLKQVFDTTRVIFQKGYVAWILITLLSTCLIYDFLFEVDQLWPLALAMPLIWYGPLNALLLMGYGIGGPIAAFIVKKRSLVIVWSIIAFIAVCLLTIHYMPLIAAAQFIAITLCIALETIALGKLHDVLPSRLRSGASSVVGTLTNLLFIPLVYVFGKLTEDHSVFYAANLLIPLGILCIIGILIITKYQNMVGKSTIGNVKPKTLPNTSIAH
jgi:MFS family permease